MKKEISLLLLLVPVAVAGCATMPPYNPFQVPQEQFHAKVKRIALAPVAIPPNLGVPDSTKLHLDALIEAKLQEAGLATFPAKEFAEFLGRMQQEVGGLFDPRTGNPDETKINTVFARIVEEIRARFQPDAVLLPRIEVVKADFGGAWARWDGVSEPLASGLSIFGTQNMRGTVPALSLVVTIYSPDGPALYKYGGGIQVLEKLAPFGERLQASFGSGKMFVPVPREELLVNEERNRTAVEIALGPLLKKPASR